MHLVEVKKEKLYGNLSLIFAQYLVCAHRKTSKSSLYFKLKKLDRLGIGRCIHSTNSGLSDAWQSTTTAGCAWSHSDVGRHPIPQTASVASQPMWLCLSHPNSSIIVKWDSGENSRHAEPRTSHGTWFRKLRYWGKLWDNIWTKIKTEHNKQIKNDTELAKSQKSICVQLAIMVVIY